MYYIFAFQGLAVGRKERRKEGRKEGRKEERQQWCRKLCGGRCHSNVAAGGKI